ncbi:MAG: Nramp family divalent metal transporter [Burkholderiales bacterium]|nr:Nramp family divalent metal transporter [Bacteroidia bacterium]
MSTSTHKSLDEVHSSVNTSSKGGFKKLLAFIGPAYMISVGYMDPGNWATDIEGGSKYGYSLIWVLVMSNLIALLLQSHCVRLGIVSGRDLAQASKDHYSKFINYFLYVLAEIAIAACDLAEVVGMAIGIHLLFPSISILMGVCITVLDSFVLLFLLNAGIKKLEAFIISLVAIIAVSFFIQLVIAEPNVVEISKGLIPGFTNENALYIAIGIIGATVMPHNLYLHSSLVQTRQFERTPVEIKKAIRFNIIDSAVALNLALFVNAAILIIAATTFFNTGVEVKEIQDAHRMMAPMLGSTLAPLLFAIALIAAGQSSTVTGTLAGQVIMEGYLNLRLQPWIRRLMTRLIAIVPAFLTIFFLGEEKTGDLLILSQVILSLQLGFAIIPLIHFVSNKKRMGDFVIPLWQKIASWISVSVIVLLNCQMLTNKVKEWLDSSEYPVLIGLIVIPFMLVCLGILIFIVFEPFFKKATKEVSTKFHGELQKINFKEQKPYSSIAITVDFSGSDNKAINKALQLGGKEAHYILIHILESTNAVMYGEDTNDYERTEDSKNLLAYKNQLLEQGYNCEFKLGFGNPKSVIPNLVSHCDLLVMGTHGHTRFKDLLFGTTVEGVRHKISIPLVLV